MIKSLLSTFYPSEIKDSTYVIPFEEWKEKGYKGVIFDVDNTLVPHGADADERSIALFQRLKELGFEENASVYCVGESPLGGMKAYLIKGAVIALRNGDAVGISVNVNDTERQL